MTDAATHQQNHAKPWTKSCKPALCAIMQECPSELRAKQWMQKHWQRLLQQLQTAGWETSRVTLAQSDITAEWGERLSTHDD